MNRNTEESESAAASQVARVEALCRSYLMVMESGDLEALLSLFTEDATATPPISGKQPVRDFYAYVMRITSARSMRLRTIFIGSSYSSRAAIHIAYTRTVGNGKPATIEGIDIFELTGDLGKFASVTIIYDTAPVQSDFDRMQVKRRLVLSGQVGPLVSFRSMRPFAKSAGVTTSCSTY